MSESKLLALSCRAIELDEQVEVLVSVEHVLKVLGEEDVLTSEVVQGGLVNHLDGLAVHEQPLRHRLNE
jgi:hypothetical protein